MSTANQLRGSQESVDVSAVICRKVNTVPVASNLAYFQVEYKVDLPDDAPANLRQHYQPTLTSGFAPPADIAAFLDDEATEIKGIPGMHIAPPGLREAMRCNMFMDALEKFQAELFLKKDRLEGLQSGAIDLDDIILLDPGSHLLFDRHGEVLPVGFRLDYSSGGYHSGRYDIDKALEILSKDPRVSPVPIRGKMQEGGLRVLRVADHFSTDDFNQRHIGFMFAPTVEDMRALLTKCKSYENNESYPWGRRYDALFDLDIFGLRAGSAAKYDDPWSTDEVTTDNE
jgi:hypothetical protein